MNPSKTEIPRALALDELMSGFMSDRFLMVDIETLDTKKTAAIVQIAARTFNPRGNVSEEDEEWSCTIDRDSNEFHGRSISQTTLDWWAMQSPGARQAVFDGPHQELSDALKNFTRWCNMLSPTCTRVWAKDPDFDIVILQDACDQLGIIWPFRFWESRSCRTAMEMAYPMGDFPLIHVQGPEHDATIDVKKQIVEIQHAYYVLGC